MDQINLNIELLKELIHQKKECLNHVVAEIELRTKEMQELKGHIPMLRRQLQLQCQLKDRMEK